MNTELKEFNLAFTNVCYPESFIVAIRKKEQMSPLEFKHELRVLICGSGKYKGMWQNGTTEQIMSILAGAQAMAKGDLKDDLVFIQNNLLARLQLGVNK